MNLQYVHLLPENFSPHSRVWIYQSSRLLSIGEALGVEDAIKRFCTDWTSHGSPVNGFGTLLFGQFIVLMADESTAGVSGCSTDSSVAFIKGLGDGLQVDFFNRTNLAFYIKEGIQALPLSQLQYAADNGFLTPDTLYFNNLVANKKELETAWIIPLKDSWLRTRLALAN